MENSTVFDDVKEVLKYWEENDIAEELPLEDVLIFYPGARAVHHKIEKFKIDIDVPEYLYEIIGLLSKGNPAFAQLLFIEMLEYLSKYDKIPKGYKIRPEDFKNTFESGWPCWDNAERNQEYKEKWDKQKNYELEGSDNSIDYPEYWEKYFA